MWIVVGLGRRSRGEPPSVPSCVDRTSRLLHHEIWLPHRLVAATPHVRDVATAWWALPLVVAEARDAESRHAVAAARGRLLGPPLPPSSFSEVLEDL